MKLSFVAVIMAFGLTACENTSLQSKRPKEETTRTAADFALETVFADSLNQLTGVAISDDGRLFVNYPFWLEQHSLSVAEVKNGRPVAYPDSSWNSFRKGQDGLNKFVCVQSVVTDNMGYLWVVDAAGIGLGPVYRKSNKVVKINLSNDKVERIYRFPLEVAGQDVYLNDIRIDNASGFAYLTSSSNGGIVVLDIRSGESRFVLDEHPSVKSDSLYRFQPDGTPLQKSDGTPLRVHSDGIALTPDNQWLYYKSLTDDRLFRVRTALLRDFGTPLQTIAHRVENLGHFVTTDGMIFDKSGNLYLGDLERSSIVRIRPDMQTQPLVTDTARLIWPDSYSISNDGYLYISVSQIHRMPWFHHDQDRIDRPFMVYRLKI